MEKSWNCDFKFLWEPCIMFCCSSLNPDEEEEERKASYESYRILVENECAGCKDFLAFTGDKY